MELPLTDLKPGESGTITAIRVRHGLRRRHGRRDRGWGLERRLMDMGLTPGIMVTVVKSAPFNGPLEVLVRGSRLVLGNGMARRIFVEVMR